MINTTLLVSCSNCEIIQLVNFKFCSNCGTENSQRNLKRIEKDLEDDKHIKYFVSYSIITISIAICFALIDDSKLNLLVVTGLFAIIDLIYAGAQPLTFKLFKVHLFSLKRALGIVLGFIGSALIVNFLIGKLNFEINEFEVSSIDPAYQFDNPLVSGLFLTALCPAIFEELSFRGFIYNNLKILRGKNAAIIGSTFLFAIVHFSVLSLFWLIPFGLILAYLREKHNTIIYGVIAHFTHNATIVIIDLYF